MQIKLDPGTEQYLKYAKNRLAVLRERRINLRLPAMVKHHKPASDVLIALKSTEWEDYIRITGGMEYYTLSTMPDPTPYRSLFLSSGSVPSFSMSFSSTDFFNTNSLITFSAGSTIYGTIAGSRTFSDPVPFPIVPGSTQTITFSNYYPGGGGNIINGTAITTFGEFGGVTDSSGLVYTAITSTGAYTSAFAAYEADIASQPPQLLVNLSDGMVLASVTQSGNPLEPTWVTNWDGSESAEHTDGIVEFEVPADVKGPTTLPIGAAREKLRLQTNSTTAIGMLEVGTVPVGKPGNSWGEIIKTLALDSTLPRVIYPFTAEYNDANESPLNGLGAAGTVYDVTVTHSITLRYTDSEGIEYEEILSGTRREISTQSDKVGETSFYSIVNIYENFPLIWDVNGVASGFYGADIYRVVNSGPQRDGHGISGINGGMGCLLTGTSTYFLLVGDSTYGEPTNPSAYSGYAPPIPQASIDITVSTSPLFLQYLRDVEPVDVNTLDDPQPPYSSNWLSTSMVDGEIITLIPFGPVKDDEDLGMFGDKTGAQKVAIYGRAKFRYNLDGSFTFLSWRYGIPESEGVSAGPIVVEMLDDEGSIDWPSSNCAVIYTAFEWSDVKQIAKEQMSVLKRVPTELTHTERFLKLLKSNI